MALAEARAAWQRAASRCFLQEDAKKRAPKLACCPLLTPPIEEHELRSPDSACGREILSGDFMPLYPDPVYGKLATTSLWWIHPQHGYRYQSRLMDENLAVMIDNDEASNLKESSLDFSVTETDFGIVDQTSAISVFSDHLLVKETNFRKPDSCDICNDPLKSDVEDGGKKAHVGGLKSVESTPGNYFDPESFEKSGPWWRNADAEELALLVAQRSHSLVQNCDLPLPQSAFGKTCLGIRTASSYHSRASTPLTHQDLLQPPSHLSSPLTGNTAKTSSYQRRRSPSESGYCCGCCGGDVGKMDGDTLQILDALHHSQTRARESDNNAKQACDEKQRIVKLFLRQASHLFAYKQWLRLLQLEKNTYLLALSGEGQQALPGFPVLAPLKPARRRSRMNTGRKKPDGRYAVVFAIGFVSIGLMLGWGMAWMLLPGDGSTL